MDSGTKNGHLEKKNHTKCSKLIFICNIHKHTCEFQHLSTLCEPTGDILYIVSTFCRVRWILRIHHKMRRMFLFLGGAFPMTISESHLHRSLLCSAHWSRCLCFSIFVLYFSSVFVFVLLYDLDVVSKKKIYKLYAKFLMIMINSYIVNVTYMVNDNRLSFFFFRKPNT